MPLKKEYVLISSLNTASGGTVQTGFNTPTNFSVHLLSPLRNVVKTDLVEVSMTIADTLATQPSYFLVQSRTLGTDILTGGANQGFWRLILNDPATNAVYASNSRVDVYTQTPRDIQDIDVLILNPDGSVYNNTNGSFTMLLEVVRLIDDGDPLARNIIAS